MHTALIPAIHIKQPQPKLEFTQRLTGGGWLWDQNSLATDKHPKLQ